MRPGLRISAPGRGALVLLRRWRQCSLFLVVLICYDFALTSRDCKSGGCPMQKDLVAGILILNWNGSDLLRRYLPSVVAAADRSGTAVAVADNGSTDDSVQFLEANYPSIRTIRLGENHGFAKGYNLAIRQVQWDVVVLLNNDMAVERDFLEHMLAPFQHEAPPFATTAQIMFEDPQAHRAETGRTCARFQRGQVEVTHLPIESEEEIEPVFYLGGGSSAVSREKFLQLGGFEELFSPFYYEDTDISWRGRKQGWPILFVPKARVIHRWHASTDKLGESYLDCIVARNRVLFTWLNLHDRRMWLLHLLWFPYYCARLTLRAVRDFPHERSSLRGVALALRLAPAVYRRRRARRRSAVVGDREIFAYFNQLWSGSQPK